MELQKLQNQIYWIFIFLMLPLMAQAQDMSTIQGMTPLQVAHLQQVNEIAIAPSGDKAAYTVSEPADPRKENRPAKYRLFVRDLDSKQSVPFVTTMSVSNIAFRPSKKSITFLSKRESDSTAGLFEISMIGGEPQRILTFPTDISSYSWAKNGNHLAFIAADTAEKSESSLPYEPEIYEENLSNQHGFIVNMADQDPKPRKLQVDGSIYQIDWSPEMRRLVVAAAPTPLVDDYYMKQQVMITDSLGQETLVTVDHEGKLGDVQWSPDGTRLAMLAAADLHDPTAGRLHIVSASDGTTQQLQPQFGGAFEQFKWTGDNELHYLASKGVWSVYGRINADGTSMESIVEEGGPYLETFARASDGTAVFMADHITHPRELYQYYAEKDTVVRLTNNNEWLADIALGRQEAVSWTASDGTELQGLLIYPVNYQKGEKYPLITTVHGGPESHYDNGWLTSYSTPGQVGAAQGYFVFYPNYRGSTGRGENFAKSSQGDMAGAEFDDIVAGVEELIKGGLVDSSKVGVTGGSYGGYATGWMATRYTDHFAAGVMFVGISNNISKWGTSDIPEELYQVHARERIWENYQSFLEQSPIYYAGQAKTPLLIMHGKEDTRVDPSQSYEMYRHIKTRTDTPVRLVLYPGEGHGNINSTARYDYSLRMMRWFNQYLQGNVQKEPGIELDVESRSVQS
ncbi:S9 family peptidase [Fodinibius sediminis]|uniref:Dipeptidyl aminopeptidase/acylaminoacyl peptidase n=1 Tax=Fodinibius sediminis TaxID=1214077 RepID=A0A521BJI8_9BACT|nr:S9 family peptidase [Fodinibius sediminis]SMO47031.1 Dipeptidyl aminopeptidase/acylaminoacyl peptidase [Fodinibius sediminis]